MPSALRQLPIWQEDGEPQALLARNSVEYTTQSCKSILNRCRSPEMPFVWTINPYRGCEFACTYCYARYTHGFLGHEDWLAFERHIYVKVNAPEVARRTIRPENLRGRKVALGTATDPYQPAERRFRITRGILESLLHQDDLRFTITTKSPLICRDIDLLRRFAERGALVVHLSFTTLDPALARLLEPRAPDPRARIRAVEELSAAGIPVSLFVMPILPAINDDEEHLEAILAAGREAAACYAVSNVLFLTSPARERFFLFLQRHFPDLVRNYWKVYSASSHQSSEYRAAVGERFEALARRHGFFPYERRAANWANAPGEQMELF
ncbi:MAG: radical SAM protein [Nitrospinota bacterium]